MKTYTLSSGETFETFVLPKGTVLFRGFEMKHGTTLDTTVPFTELFGRQDAYGEYCVDPHHNTFFYPAPFMVDVVNRYSIHAIYITNYDLELVLMIQPSTRTRDARGAIDKAPYSSCTDISTIDECGKKRIHHDPCLSSLLLKEFPGIHGYIAIAQNDAGHFEHGYFPYMLKYDTTCAKSVAPFVVENARGLQSVPEIVLYPYHVRTSYDTRKIHPRAVDSYPIWYAIKHRAELNYFPLLYITEKKVYTFTQLASDKVLEEMGNTDRTELEYRSPLLEREKLIVEHALSPSGFTINGVKFQFTVDLRTGFYIASHKLSTPRTGITITKNISLYRNAFMEPYEPKDEFIVPFHYPRSLKMDLHGFLRKPRLMPPHEDDFVRELNRHSSSFSKHYEFSIKNPKKYTTSYKLEVMFPRPDLKIPPKRRFTRKIKRPATSGGFSSPKKDEVL
jgi:hypothetical protein